MLPLKNRKFAGILLAEKLSKLKWDDACVLALPRGGVPVAYEVAKKLKLPWDILLVKKIGAPGHPEFAIGAISEIEGPVWNKESINHLRLSSEKLRTLAEQTRKKILDQTTKWRGARSPLDLNAKTVILVDDGLATGLTMFAAIRFLKAHKALKIVVVAPVASKSAAAFLKLESDDVVILDTPDPFFSVGHWYEDFSQVTDDMVSDLLATQGREAQVETKKIDVKIEVDPVGFRVSSSG